MYTIFLEDSIIIIKANEKEQIGIHIKDKDLAILQGNLFDQVWKIAEIK